MVVTALKPVVCAVSGGVDSAVAALRLVRAGHHVTGLFMRNWDTRDEEPGIACSADLDQAHAQHVCDKLGIKLQTVDFTKDYWNYVFLEMLETYKLGQTPNPDVLCNKFIKFGSLVKHVETFFGPDHLIATGHYARTSDLDAKPVYLRMPVDAGKDQTLFLSQVKQQSLQKALFPVGNSLKKNVRKEATDNNLHVVEMRKESFGVCFIGERHFAKFLKQYIPEKKGDVVNLETGEVIGSHSGVYFSTIGQQYTVPGYPWPIASKKSAKKGSGFFVCRRDGEKNILYVVFGPEHPALYFDALQVLNIHWIAESVPDELSANGEMECDFRFQNIGRVVPCKVRWVSKVVGFEIWLKYPERAVAPGQYAVFYKGDVCLGSGQITHSISLYDSRLQVSLQT